MGEVWIFLIQLHQKTKIEFQSYFPWIVLVGIPLNSTNINNTHIQSIEWNWKIEGENEFYNNSGLKDPFKGLSFFISPELKFYMKMRKQNEDIILNIINWLHSDSFYTDVHTEIV